jgi:hypothetical protein
MKPLALKPTLMWLLLAVSVSATGCDEDEPQRGDAPVPGSSSAAEHREAWLQPNSKYTAAQWLASRTSAEAKPLSDPEVKRLAVMLDNANKLYRESERMIANRAVQLEGMLKGIGVSEPASEILDDLTRIAGEVGQTEGFGAVSQHYYNLRSNDIGRGEALAALKSRYGKRQ